MIENDLVQARPRYLSRFYQLNLMMNSQEFLSSVITDLIQIYKHSLRLDGDER
jgi:hypothetical protein